MEWYGEPAREDQLQVPPSLPRQDLDQPDEQVLKEERSEEEGSSSSTKSSSNSSSSTEEPTRKRAKSY